MIEWLLEADRALGDGRLDDARKRYEQVVVTDPRNAIAMVGLARVAIARGDHDAAAGHIGQALAIDPENAAARRHAADLTVRHEPSATAEPTTAADPLSSAPMSHAANPLHLVPLMGPETSEPSSTPEPVVAAPRTLLRRLLGRR